MSERLSADEQRKLDAMVALHEQWLEVARKRLVVLVRAASYTMTGQLTVRDVCKALQISEATWYRWANELGLRELAAETVAQIDRALREAGADETTTVADVVNDPDLALAAGKIGAWPRTKADA